MKSKRNTKPKKNTLDALFGETLPERSMPVKSGWWEASQKAISGAISEAPVVDNRPTIACDPGLEAFAEVMSFGGRLRVVTRKR